MIPSVRIPEYCTDPAECARSYRAHESSWRMTPAEQIAEWSGTCCPECGGRFMTAEEIVAALLSPDTEVKR